jgi:hypothetical protein
MRRPEWELGCSAAGKKLKMRNGMNSLAMSIVTLWYRQGLVFLYKNADGSLLEQLMIAC